MAEKVKAGEELLTQLAQIPTEVTASALLAHLRKLCSPPPRLPISRCRWRRPKNGLNHGRGRHCTYTQF